jgi:predicted nucleotidyltransferase
VAGVLSGYGHEANVKGRLHNISEEQRRRIEKCLASEVMRDEEVVFAYLYGSFVESQPFHDIDVAVYLRDVRAEVWSPKVVALAQRLTDRTGKPVDVRALNLAPVSFVYHVLRGHLLFTRDESLLADVIERTVSRYLDAAPLIRQATREAFMP